MKCQECRRIFPPDLISEMAVQEYGQLVWVSMCPLCAKRWRNRRAGLPEDTPNGPRTRLLHLRALAHLEKTGQRAS